VADAGSQRCFSRCVAGFNALNHEILLSMAWPECLITGYIGRFGHLKPNAKVYKGVGVYK
jgi:hypothetical protein